MTFAAHARKIHFRWRRVWRAALISIIVVSISLVVLFVAANRIPWFGPALADGLRAVIGVEAVTRLEEWVYGVDDGFNRFWRKGEKPQAYWTVPSDSPAPDPPAKPDAASAPVVFRPRDVGALDPRVAAPGDGVWVAVSDAVRPDAAPILYKTLIHPDRQRPWAAVFVVALDASRVELHVLAGTADPEATLLDGRAAPRPARVPADEQPRLLAAFNGGFKTEHGHYGMRVGGITLVPPRRDVCTIAAYEGESLRIATWSQIAETESKMQWWRQTPPCMVEHGEIHPALRTNGTTNWGAALGGETAIRRSAIGLDASASILFVAVSESTTAGAMARAMFHAGSHAAAQLDVNWAFPKFVIYRPKDGKSLVADGLFPGFVFESDEYIGRPALKDFFYVLRR